MRSKILQEILDDTPKELEIFTDLYGDIVDRINSILIEKRMFQKDLAAKLGKSPSEINKWLNGDHNFTLRSLAKLQFELGEIILEVPEKRSKIEYKKTSNINIPSVDQFITLSRLNNSNVEHWSKVNKTNPPYGIAA